MYLEKFEVGYLETNCYIVKARSNASVIIDPGGGFDRIRDYVNENKLDIKAVLLTHGHFDHTKDVHKWQALKIPVYINKNDAKYLDPEKSPSLLNFKCFVKVIPDHFLEDSQLLQFDDLKVKVMHTPGHSPGSVSLIIGDDIYSGDTLFLGDYGRTDFSDGSFEEIKISLKRLFSLSHTGIDYKVHPGHGPDTLLRSEMIHNAINY
ncbi:MAG: MBL fold metallo-hydrolase [Christensenellaceae bacterium]|jgi:glyoxylase-like metal-dependent hydrolase (beta-lactamase superfamily II)|nr:MBL fold metallo-hydrolase [Christensenellaceae bacterium]